MLKKVKITIDSTTRARGDSEEDTMRELADGYVKYTERGVVLLSYKTKSEAGEVTTEILPEGSGFAIRRRGAIQSEIILEEGKSHDSVYRIPPYSFDMSVQARSVVSTLTKDGGELILEYSMSVGADERECIFRLHAE